MDATTTPPNPCLDIPSPALLPRAEEPPAAPAVVDTRPMWMRVSDAARDVVRAYGDEDPTAPQRSNAALQELLTSISDGKVRTYALPDRHLVVFFDAKPGDDLRTLPGSFALAQVAGYVEAVLPDGAAIVLKDRSYEPGPLPMSTEVLHMADHVFVDYWAGDSEGRSENCAAFHDGKMFCNQPYEQHPTQVTATG